MGCRPGVPRHCEGSGSGESGAQVAQRRRHALRSLPAAGPQPVAARRSASIPLLTAVCSCCRAWGRSGGGSDRCSRARAGCGAGSISRCGARTHARRPPPRRQTPPPAHLCGRKRSARRKRPPVPRRRPEPAPGARSAHCSASHTWWWSPEAEPATEEGFEKAQLRDVTATRRGAGCRSSGGGVTRSGATPTSPLHVPLHIPASCSARSAAAVDPAQINPAGSPRLKCSFCRFTRTRVSGRQAGRHHMECGRDLLTDCAGRPPRPGGRAGAPLLHARLVWVDAEAEAARRQAGAGAPTDMTRAQPGLQTGKHRGTRARGFNRRSGTRACGQAAAFEVSALVADMQRCLWWVKRVRAQLASLHTHHPCMHHAAAWGAGFGRAQQRRPAAVASDGAIIFGHDSLHALG